MKASVGSNPTRSTMNEDQERLVRCLKVHPDAVLFESSVWDSSSPLLRCSLCLYPLAEFSPGNEYALGNTYTVPNTRLPLTWLVNVKMINLWGR